MNEPLTQARDTAKFAAIDLRDALAKANPVAALVILPLIAGAERLAQQIDALRAAAS